MHANLEDLIATNDLTPEAVDIWKRVPRGEKVYASTKRRRKDGSIVEVEIHGIPLVIKRKLIGVYGIYHDVSQFRSVKKRKWLDYAAADPHREFPEVSFK